MALHQKRTLAFINHFIVKSVQFLNNFACQCEEKLLNVELRMQKLEASLKILETKLSSIPDIKETTENKTTVEIIDHTNESTNLETEVETISTEDQMPKHDPIYDKFFKMIQFGVRIEDVKSKMLQEGLDPSVVS